MHWQKVSLIGVGLLGGSLGLALKARGRAGTVAGYVRRAESVSACLELGVVDTATLDLAEAVQGADIVVLCTPLGQMEDLARRMAPHLAPGALVTDVGSVKVPVVEALTPLCREVGAGFLGAHPMAGGERMGMAAARADLFDGACCVVTPAEDSPEADRVRGQAFWESVGMRVRSLGPAEHDRLVGWSSHLPHVAAAALAGTILEGPDAEAVRALCGTGFRDTTRVASGSPEMWRDIALTNRKALGEALQAFEKDLEAARRLVESGDAEAIEGFFRRVKERRDAWLQASGSGPALREDG